MMGVRIKVLKLIQNVMSLQKTMKVGLSWKVIIILKNYETKCNTNIILHFDVQFHST